MLISGLIFLLFAVIVCALPTAAPPKVTLRQGIFTGATRRGEGHKLWVHEFLGIPYAQPPVGDLRLRPPRPVPASSTSFDATRFGMVCPQASLNVPRALGPTNREDCLTLNVFIPHNPAGWDFTPSNKLPVAVNIHGGAFNLGAARAVNVSSLVSWSDRPFIGVSINYRLGALGFLPSILSAREGALNLGLKDQILALQWVNENIAAFGGDPSQVTLFGVSAGAHSIGHHLLNLQEGPQRLFQRVIMDNGAPTARKVPNYNESFVNQQFALFRNRVDCGGIPDSQVFSCLRQVETNKFINASVTIFAQYAQSTLWPFQPVVDGDVIPLRPTIQWKTGMWNRVPILTLYSTDEGTMFVPYDHNMGTSQNFTDFFRTLIPLFSEDDHQKLDKLYPDPLVYPNSPYRDSRQGLGAQFKRASAAYGQYGYICNVLTTALQASSYVPVWLMHWDTNVSTVLGASHTSHTPYKSFELGIRRISKTQHDLASTLAAYVTSFITTGDPNIVKGYLGQNRPHWGNFDDRLDGGVMVMGEGNDERAGGNNLGTVAMFQDHWRFDEECNFWNERHEKLDR